ncbi:BNR-4 repeat-containing protein [Candidatus Woesearchaeota archaeon]|nr:BNR-4 repeat-containing protein [Candidatus Woesearchaeota archaeon]
MKKVIIVFALVLLAAFMLAGCINISSCGDGICTDAEKETCPADCSSTHEKCAKEGEYTSGQVSPEYYFGCCDGLKGFNTNSERLKGAGQLCYDPDKGAPECNAGATISENLKTAEGWYYPSGELLRSEDCGEVPNEECRDENSGCMVSDIPCCDGLKAVNNCFETDGGCECANCGSVCRPCGNDKCDDNENVCNCPEDCAPIQGGGNGECPEKPSPETCPEGIVVEDGVDENGCTNYSCQEDVQHFCVNSPPPNFCILGMDDVIVTGKYENGCSIYGCRSEIEAEDADSITGPMQIAKDTESSGGSYIYVPNGAGSGGAAIYNLEIETAGDYVIWGRVIAPNGTDDSFYVEIDDSGDKLWDMQSCSVWQWDIVSDRGQEDPVKFYLTEGEHTLKVKKREDGAKLDKLVVTDDLDLDLVFEEKADLSKVWSGHPVGFDFLSYKDRQFVAFYNEDRKLTVMSRILGESEWDKIELPTSIGWDSHNSIKMAIDDNEDIHLAGNMHVSPLTYFRTTRPLDITSFKKIDNMVGSMETKVTYPIFFRGPENEFIFTYRDGSSGNGQNYYNAYDHNTKTWGRFLDKALVSGEGLMNAYYSDPVKDKEGIFHLVGIWRDNGDASSNHDIFYAKSVDFLNWETASGNIIDLPITINNCDIVDPVPVGGGAINGNVKIGFDTQSRPIVSYHKYDSDGNTQIYNARLEDGIWKIYQATQWAHRWDFGGGGSIVFEVKVGPVVLENNELTQTYSFSQEPDLSGKWVLDEETLTPTGKSTAVSNSKKVPSELKDVETECLSCDAHGEELGVKFMFARGDGTGSDDYFLRWETLPVNRDLTRDYIPPPSQLRIYKFS